MNAQIPDNAAAPIAEGMHHGRVNTDPQHFETVIIGTGFSGLLAAIRLKQQHFDNFVLLERSSDLGGTWRDNSYPGAEVDVPTGLYSISFVPYPFRKQYAPQSELLAYTHHIIKKFHLREHVKTNQAVTRLTWDKSQCVWNVEVASGERYVARFVIDTSGVLANPRTPDIEGAETFQGASFHTAQWNHDVSYAGKRGCRYQRDRENHVDRGPDPGRQGYSPGHHRVRDGVLCLYRHGQGAHVPGLWPGRPKPEQRMGKGNCLLQRHHRVWLSQLFQGQRPQHGHRPQFTDLLHADNGELYGKSDSRRQAERGHPGHRCQERCTTGLRCQGEEATEIDGLANGWVYGLLSKKHDG